MNFIMSSLHYDVIKTVLREIFLISCGNTQAFSVQNSQVLSFSITLIVVVLLSCIVDAKKEKKWFAVRTKNRVSFLVARRNLGYASTT